MAIVTCPTCRAPVEWHMANRFRPFCSERCKNIDLGAWASERYAIEGGVPEPAPDAPREET